MFAKLESFYMGIFVYMKQVYQSKFSVQTNWINHVKSKFLKGEISLNCFQIDNYNLQLHISFFTSSMVNYFLNSFN